MAEELKNGPKHYPSSYGGTQKEKQYVNYISAFHTACCPCCSKRWWREPGGNTSQSKGGVGRWKPQEGEGGRLAGWYGAEPHVLRAVVLGPGAERGVARGSPEKGRCSQGARGAGTGCQPVKRKGKQVFVGWFLFSIFLILILFLFLFLLNLLKAYSPAPSTTQGHLGALLYFWSLLRLWYG